MLSALQTKFGASMVVANMIGGVVVFVFLGFVLPRPQRYLDANVIALVSYLTFAMLAGFVISARAFLPIRSWVLGDAGTTEANRCYVVTHARRQAVINFCIWMGSGDRLHPDQRALRAAKRARHRVGDL
jgi:hypothetical protein